MPSSISTERVILRRLEVADLRAVHILFSEPGHSFTAGPVTDVAETRRWLETRQACFEGSGYAWYGLWDPSGELIGTCGVLLSARCTPDPEIGYEIATARRGLGYAREAVHAVTAAAHDFGVDRLWATVRASNEPSRRVLDSTGYLPVCSHEDERGTLDYCCHDDPGR